MALGMRHGPRHAWVDDRKAPLLRVEVPASFTYTELAEFLQVLRDWMLEDVNRPYGIVTDIKRISAVDAKMRSLLAESEKSYAHIERRYSAGQAYVTPSKIMRSLLIAVFWISPPVYPCRIVATVDEAEAWVKEDLALALAEYPSGPYWQERRAAARSSAATNDSSPNPVTR